jgi:hypothetical protein
VESVSRKRKAEAESGSGKWKRKAEADTRSGKHERKAYKFGFSKQKVEGRNDWATNDQVIGQVAWRSHK